MSSVDMLAFWMVGESKDLVRPPRGSLLGKSFCGASVLDFQERGERALSVIYTS